MSFRFFFFCFLVNGFLFFYKYFLNLFLCTYWLLSEMDYPGFLMRPAGVAGEASVYQQPAFHR